MEKNINLKKTSFLIFISFFPIFIFRSNLNINEIVYTLFIFLVPTLSINYFILKKKIFNKFLFIFYISLIIAYGIDNHLGMWNGFILPFKHKFINIFGILYIPGLILIVCLSLLISYFILIGKDKFYNIILVFLCTIFIFGIFDKTKSHKNINSFINENDKRYTKTKLIIIFDEMAGMTSFESANDKTSNINNYIKKFFEKHNFEFYSDVVSITRNTGASLSALLNFSENTQTRVKSLKTSPSYFFEYELTKNLLFDKYKDISVYQNTHIDFCNYAGVSKCESYNPFTKKGFLNGFKDTYLSKIISIWKLNGSISSIIVWRSLRQLRVIDSTLEPEGHKAAFQGLFKSLEKDISSKKYDLIFVHTLVPHRPYGFDAQCNYDGGLSVANRYFSIVKMVKQHNLERKCTLVYLDSFLENLKNNNSINSIDLTILSDHGARIKKTKDSRLPSIFAFRNDKTIYKENKGKKILQGLFTEHLK
jgi:hypothetical protein